MTSETTIELTPAENAILDALRNVEIALRAAGEAVDTALPNLPLFNQGWTGINWAMQMDGSDRAPGATIYQGEADEITRASGITRAEARSLSSRYQELLTAVAPIAARRRNADGVLPTNDELFALLPST